MSAASHVRTTNRLLAVVDDPRVVDRTLAGLAAAGVPRDAVTVLVGPDGAPRLEPRPNLWTRLVDLISFIAADQAVDVAWYRAALETGRAVLVMTTPNARLRRAAVEVLRGAGAHFVNHYGWMATEDVIPWRGDPPPVHWRHHR